MSSAEYAVFCFEIRAISLVFTPIGLWQCWFW